MFVWDLLAAFVVALFFLVLLVGLVGWGRPDRTAPPEGAPRAVWAGVLFLFLILFFGVWAGGIWIEPFGPEVWGIAWLPFLFAGLILALLVAAAAPPARWRGGTRSRLSEPAPETAGHRRREDALAVSFGLFFWLLVGVFVLALLVAYA